VNAVISRRADDGSFCSLENELMHVWVSNANELRCSEEQIWALLSPQERQRSAAFHFEGDARRYRVAHALLRDVLSRYLRIKPAAMEFTANAYGKPLLAGVYRAELAFNLSHSGEVSVCAIAIGNSIGADVERIRMLEDLSGLAATSFSPRERGWLDKYAGAELCEAFFACWTRKEAYVKARGEGLSIPLKSFDVEVDPHAAAGKFCQVSGLSGPNTWWWANLPLAPGYASAIVVENSPPRAVVLMDWSGPVSLK
jgi:4'-phosphopantetheinyl transferase